jgi:hypothetical protein
LPGLLLLCRVLVMERLSGVPLTDLAAIRAVTSKDPEGVLISALNTWFASVLGADTFHADVHAGGSRCYLHTSVVIIRTPADGSLLLGLWHTTGKMLQLYFGSQHLVC